MTNKCKDARCDAFARKLTGTEIKNLGGFNLLHQVCEGIFMGTCKGFCPSHAAEALTEDLRPDASIIDVIKRKWDYWNQDNFADAKGYAICSICPEFLLADRRKHPVSLVESTLGALYVPEQRIRTIVWLQNGASAGLGTCFDCSLDVHTHFQYDGAGHLIETELDRMCQADMEVRNEK